MINPTDHELNEVLARVCGADRIEKRMILFTDYIVMEKEVDCYVTKAGQYICDVESWNPLHDANQMERVKAKFRKRNIIHISTWTIYGYLVELLTKKDEYKGHDKSELRAFALAVYAMTQSQKGTT